MKLVRLKTLFFLPFVLFPSLSTADATRDRDVVALLPAQFVEDTGAANRIEAGDILRTVSQEVAAAVCHFHNGVAPDLSEKLLNEGIGKFDVMLDALLNGNENLGIVGGEERRKTIALLEQVGASWQPTRDAALGVIAEPTDTSAVNVVYGSATTLLDQTYLLLSELEGEYANPVELLQADVMLLEVSGRQSMLTQRLSYLACRAWSGTADANYKETLATTLSQFDFAMGALRNGMPEMGIMPPPTDEIADLLERAAADWTVIEGHIATMNDADIADTETADALYRMLADKMYTMEEVAHQYALYSKRVY
ncbi:type IV pili methyl-accepting chemotaxis transducer N-terminal domain-containing protein [Yoonia sp. 2307UL14-13]|uniref:type IV pili methyl-accepting chemotaxis transducer N-terminal domain-containing protein n=1 Tax=Yoonia sp. 2307UL14-13 TaxID=3126506 RepID=UPI0030AA9D0F